MITGAVLCVVAIAVAGTLGSGRGAAGALGPAGAPVRAADASSPASAEPAARAEGAEPQAVPTAVSSAEASDDEPAERPDRVKIADHGSGEFRRAAVSVQPPTERGRLLRYSVQIEKGLPFGRTETARQIAGILNDDRSWTGTGDWRFQLVARSERVDFRILVATPDTTDRLCAPLLTFGRVSCQSGRTVILNARRWAYGIKSYDGDLDAYRTYLVNHEVGHRLGRGHVGCPGEGRKAPVMMQQTKGLHGCRPNPWP